MTYSEQVSKHRLSYQQAAKVATAHGVPLDGDDWAEFCATVRAWPLDGRRLMAWLGY